MFAHGLGELARGVARLIYPTACLICDVPEPEGEGSRHGLCCDCASAVTTDAHEACPRCAATIGPHTDVSAGCAVCRGESLGFARAVRLGVYDGRLRDGILRMKSWPGEAVAEMLGRVMAEEKGPALRAAGAGVVVPVPLHWRHRWVRGYNQAGAVARELASALRLPFEPGWLRRVNATPQHAQPSATARRENIRGAFRRGWRASPAGKTVLLVDDVMTTGSTLGEAARVLLDAGAAEVVAAVLARR